MDQFWTMLYERYENDILTAEVDERRRIVIDWNDLPLDMQGFLSTFTGEQLADAIRKMEERLKLDTETDLKLGIKNFPQTIDMDRCSEGTHAQKLVQVEGLIGGFSAPMSYVSRVVWRCTACENRHTIDYQFYDRANEKNYCPDCRRVTFNELLEEYKTNYQSIEVVRPIQIIGRAPDSLRVIVRNDLVEFGDIEENKLTGGNKIRIIGLNNDFPAYRDSVRRKPYVDAVTWFVDEFIKLTDNDIEEIKEMSQRPTLVKDMVGSVATSIVDYDEIKLSILLQAVGGVTKKRKDGTIMRGTIHVLIISDPSLGKTQLGNWVVANVPKSRYVVCSSMSRAGLGASLRRDEKLGFWYIEAGALLLANGSVCVTDEVDKADGDDLDQLDMVMESEKLTVTKVKAGTFPCKTSILALGNPKNGRFDYYDRNFSEQIKIQEQTASRFDLKFVLMDKIDKVRDQRIIASKRMDIQPIIPRELLSKYLYYAKSLEPTMTEECHKKIEEFYLEFREKSMGQGGVLAITPRQGDSLIRISEAFAKLRLASEVSLEDVENAKKVFEAYLRSFSFDDRTGVLDIDMAEGRKSKSKKDMIYQVLEIVREIDDKNNGRGAREDEIITTAIERKLDENFVKREALPELVKSTELFSPFFGFFKLVNA